MKLGIIAYPFDTGLGRQTYDLFNNLKPEKTLVIDINRIKGLPAHNDRFPGARITKGMPSNADCDWLLDGVDAVFICETPLNYYLIERANQLGKKTILQYNYEFLDYFLKPNLPKPSIFAAPARWNLELLNRDIFPNIAYLPVPVDLTKLPKREITSASSFFHIVGIPAIHDRNGTLDFIQAVQKIKIEAEFIIYIQKSPQSSHLYDNIINGARSADIQVVEDLEDYTDLYKQGDIMVLPRRYGGLCLPAQEAVGSGIPVLMPNISPNNDWLPHDWMIPVVRDKSQFSPRGLPIDVHNASVHHIAQMMEDLHSYPRRAKVMHKQAKEISNLLSWESMKPKYEQFIESVCLQQS